MSGTNPNCLRTAFQGAMATSRPWTCKIGSQVNLAPAIGVVPTCKKAVNRLRTSDSFSLFGRSHIAERKRGSSVFFRCAVQHEHDLWELCTHGTAVANAGFYLASRSVPSLGMGVSRQTSCQPQCPTLHPHIPSCTRTTYMCVCCTHTTYTRYCMWAFSVQCRLLHPHNLHEVLHVGVQWCVNIHRHTFAYMSEGVRAPMTGR